MALWPQYQTEIRYGGPPRIYAHCTYQLHFDGGAKPNPGRAGAGAVIRENWGNCDMVAEIISPLGDGLGWTNNVAEYHGLIAGLEVACDLGICNVAAFGDSALVCNQYTGANRCHSDRLWPLLCRVKELAAKFQSFTLQWTPRINNRTADGLASEAINLVPCGY